MARVETARSGLLEQAKQLAGRTAAGEEPRVLTGPDGPLTPLEAPPTPPAPDGYQRRSPVQPLYGRADRDRRRAVRIGWAVALALAVVCVAAMLLLR